MARLVARSSLRAEGATTKQVAHHSAGVTPRDRDASLRDAPQDEVVWIHLFEIWFGAEKGRRKAPFPCRSCWARPFTNGHFEG
jgi:hypothetical protein